MSVLLSEDRRYIAQDLMDLSVDPEVAERAIRAETMRALASREAPARGEKGSPVQIVIFSDFQCPYCKLLGEILETRILPRAEVPVLVRFRNLPRPSHGWAEDAALIGACVAKQGDAAFWRYHDRLFSEQSRVFRMEKPIAEMEAIARAIPGLSLEKFDQCRLRRESHEIISADARFAADHDLVGAPTIFVNGTRFEGVPQEQEFLEAIKMAAHDEPVNHDRESGYSKALVDVLLWARTIAPQYGAHEIRPEHLLLGTLSGSLTSGGRDSALDVLGVSPAQIAQVRIAVDRFAGRATPYEVAPGDLPLSETAQRLMRRATLLAEQRGEPPLCPLHLLLSILESGDEMARALNGIGVTQDAVIRALQGR